MLWSAYDKLDVKILEPSSNTPVLNIPVSDKKYSNTLAFRFGGQYHALDWLTARMGMYVDESPVRSDYLNPETPSMTKLAYTAGVTFRPVKWMNIDIAYGYVKFGRSRTYGFLSLHQLGVGHRERKNWRQQAFPKASSPIRSPIFRVITPPGPTHFRSA